MSVEVWSAVETTHVCQRAPGSTRLVSPVLIGRAAELNQLRAAVRQPPAIVLVEGEAGIGKSRLIRDWLAEPALAATTQLLGHCSPLREPLPFGPVIDALTGAVDALPDREQLSPVTGALRPLLPELADRLPAALPPLGSRRHERHRVFRGIRDLLTSLGPAVLVLEDLHWIDAGTQELLRFLTDRPPPELTLVITYRREDLADPSAPGPLPPIAPAASPLRLVLPPLDPAQVAELVRAVYHTEVPADFAAYLRDRTMGIPLVVEETLGLLWERQRIAVGASGPADRLAPLADPPRLLLDQLAVPAALRDALWERVGRLSRSARRMLHAAAVLATPATEQVLAQVGTVSTRHSTNSLTELIERGLLRPAGHGRYEFRHGLAQQAVLDSLAEPARRALHRRAVTVLGQTGESRPLSQLAHHSRQAGLFGEWRCYAEAAADQAIALGDDETATTLLYELVTGPDAGVTVADRVRLAIKLGRAASSGLNHGEAVAVLERTLTAADLPRETRGELRLCLGILLRNQARRSRAGWTELEQAVPELADQPQRAARAMASLGAPYLIDGRHIDEHLHWLDRAVATAATAGDPELETVVAANRVAALISTGDPAGWQLAGPLPAEPGAQPSAGPLPAEPGGQPSAGPLPAEQGGQPLGRQPLMTVNAAWSAVCVGAYQRADLLLRAGEQLVKGTCGNYLSGALDGTALLYDYAVGNWDGLATRAEHVAQTMSDVPSVAAEASLVLGLLALAAGDLRDSQTHLAAATGSVPVAVAATAGLARLAAAGGDLATAGALVTDGLALVRSKGVWCWSAELLSVATAVLGRHADHRPALRLLLDEVEAGIQGRDAPLAVAGLTASRALLAEATGDHLAAAARHAEAARGYALLPRPYLAAQSWEARGRCLLAAGRDATSALTEALSTYERLGAAWDLGRCRHLLRSLGQALPHRRGRRGYGGQLSPREQEVVRLVRTGLTNREVAEALFLSPRTVEAHVARALRKLGLPSRLALRRAPRSPLLRP